MTAEAANGASLEWRAWPLVQYPGRTAAAFAAVLLAGAVVAWMAENAALGVIGALVLLGSLQGHFLPRRYRLDEEGATATVLGWSKRRPWDYFHSYYADRLGVMLSTFAYASRMDSFRGFNLRFAADNRDAVVAYVAERLPAAERRRRVRGEK